MANVSMVTRSLIFGMMMAGSPANAMLHAGSRDDRQRSLVVQQSNIEQQLIICNAYTSKVPLDILFVRTQLKMTSGKPLAYKQCMQSSVALAEGDQLDFKAGHNDVGTFYTTGLPKYQSSLLLVAHRRNPHAIGLRFESHAFAQVQNPQIAVIDASPDKSSGTVKISESLLATSDSTHEAPMEDDLRFNSVVAVNPGAYHLSLAGNNSTSFNAATSGKYVVMRVGSGKDAEADGEYPQELVLFMSGSFHISLCLSAFATTIVLALRGY
mmetsp:Transcript_71909/g.113958  ORF Transcript_71909/g.113958 Transcript_71909/m.113958 type:complete len:268 (-) Transcript_71909:20-823(-)|eukprot:CAMPEP_0169061240 /NCGR_PEP_ID=MMETSP1015-20121227/3_1 /TAXON_ID=342587 /ORGANISM="Karlodinium micrum, Strain CCMP2283" /LENGTH=267 /DNA_ID=CAMNT_0009119211 /DNA_START=62 /DNA_END=865 /DNA_ORIENTATION=-